MCKTYPLCRPAVCDQNVIVMIMVIIFVHNQLLLIPCSVCSYVVGEGNGEHYKKTTSQLVISCDMGCRQRA